MSDLKEIMTGIRGVLFDVDGTLIDSMGLWADVDRIYLSRRGMAMPADLSHKLSGISVSQAADYFREVLGIRESPEAMISEWNALAYEQYRYHVPAKEDAVHLLQTLTEMGIPMAVGTSNTRQLAMTVLEVLDLKKYFQVILTGEDVLKGKPDPYIYQEAAAKLGVDARDCLVFEDIPNGIRAGLAAGARTCAVYDLFSEGETEEMKGLAHYYIRSFRDLFTGEAQKLR